MKYLLLLFTCVAFSQNISQVLENRGPQTEGAVTMHASDKSVIVIDPKARSKDLAQAFLILRKEKPTLKITVATSHGELSGVTDLQASDGGTLVLIKMLSNQGTRTTIIPVEQIMEIGYTP